MSREVFIGANHSRSRFSHSNRSLTSKSQKGFTFIEILVVVAIIGFLLSTAIPMYVNYNARAKISEVMSMAKAVQHGITEHYMSTGEMVSDPSEASINLSPDQSEYIAAINFGTTASSATVTYTLGNMFAEGDIAVVGSIEGNKFSWRCNTEGTTVLNKYLPPNCHR